MSEKFNGDREKIKEFGKPLIELSDTLDSFVWKPDSPIIGLYLNRELFRTYGNALINGEAEGYCVGESTKKADNKFLFYLKEDDEHPIMIGEKIKPEEPNLKIYLTKYGSEIAEGLALEIKRKEYSIGEEARRRSKKRQDKLDEWLLVLHKSMGIGRPVSFNYILEYLPLFLGKNPLGKDKCETLEALDKLIKSEKLGIKNGETYYKNKSI